jgi:hypothetical protein
MKERLDPSESCHTSGAVHILSGSAEYRQPELAAWWRCFHAASRKKAPGHLCDRGQFPELCPAILYCEEQINCWPFLRGTAKPFFHSAGVVSVSAGVSASGVVSSEESSEESSSPLGSTVTLTFFRLASVPASK